MACAPRDYVYNRSLKTRSLKTRCLSSCVLGLFGSLLFVPYSSGQAATSRALSQLHTQLFFLNKEFQGGG